jgi:hypothetical protein
VGDRDRRNVHGPPREELLQPGPRRHILAEACSDDSSCPVDQQRAQIAVTAFADPADTLLGTACANPWCQSEPGREVSCRFELLSVANASDDRACRDRSHSWGGSKPLAGLRILVPRDNARLHGFDPRGQDFNVIERLFNCCARLVGQKVAANPFNALPELGNPLNALPTTIPNSVNSPRTVLIAAVR